jgi:hypothetical protein
MGKAGSIAVTAAIWMAGCGAAAAVELKVVEVSFPEVNCTFNPACTITVSDTVGVIGLPLDDGKAILQSRTFTGSPGAPAAGKNGYMYRVDLTQAKGWVDCLVGLTVDFGALVKQPYVKGSADLFDVFVGIKGGVGTVSVKSAEQDGDAVSFFFSNPLCVGDTTFFFGLTAEKGPQSVPAGVFGYGRPPFVAVEARGPGH